ncbi:B12-binding domain-containing radical SAM protein [Candidatus Woesearchaeota archaeon]|nr:B12-binding domain-containing radical SAM protein [Candidatus Woesearchaeota archaeon]
MPKKVLLVNPPSSLRAYSKSKIKVAIPEIPILNLATLAGSLILAGHDVQILDLAISPSPLKDLVKKLESFNPNFVGVTCTTPLFHEAANTSREVKKINKEMVVIAGGSHPTALPEDTLLNSDIDIVVMGEGDYIICDIVKGKKLSEIKGICFRKNGKIIKNERCGYIEDLDKLPYPAWHLFDIKKYKTPRLTSKKNPVGAIETSRGCIYNCTYCNKKIHGTHFRFKSAKRVVDEMEYMLNAGFNEIHIWEDQFSTDLPRAKKICDLIVERGLKFPWNIFTGIRVNCIDEEFLRKAKRAGCYSISFGPESGNQHLLNNIRKGITLDQCRRAFKLARKVGIETVAFFMLALPGETEETMKKTIDFAIELDPDYAKGTMTLPFPSTPLFDELDKKGLIKSKDWSLYNFHNTTEVYTHPNLDWDTIQKYYDLFYRKFYFRPKYIARRIAKGLLNGNVFYDIYYFIKNWLS